jgi:hypothetical protein
MGTDQLFLALSKVGSLNETFENRIASDGLFSFKEFVSLAVSVINPDIYKEQEELRASFKVSNRRSL